MSPGCRGDERAIREHREREERSNLPIEGRRKVDRIDDGVIYAARDRGGEGGGEEWKRGEVGELVMEGKNGHGVLRKVSFPLMKAPAVSLRTK